METLAGVEDGATRIPKDLFATLITPVVVNCQLPFYSTVQLHHQQKNRSISGNFKTLDVTPMFICI